MAEELKACRNCGGQCDPKGWMCGDGRQGPECEGCGITTPDVETWNRLMDAKLPSQAGEAVAWRVGFELYRTYEGALANVRNPDLKPEPLYTHPADKVAEGVVVSRELHLRSLNMLSNYVSTLAGIGFPDNDEGDYRQRINESERARVNRAIKELRALLAKSEGVKP